MASAATTKLSSNDVAVLGALFDPEASLQNHARVGAVQLAPYSSSVLSMIKDKELDALKLMNSEQPSLTEVEKAVSGLDDIIESYPKYPSAWNNRAQANRIIHDAVAMEEKPALLQGIFTDLAQAIQLASSATPVDMVSPENASVLASAHTHRGYLLWRASRSGAPVISLDNVETLRGLDTDQLEEMASREFSLGGKYGNQTAQQLAVKTNPYAKLCGSIVKEALQKEMKDFYEMST